MAAKKTVEKKAVKSVVRTKKVSEEAALKEAEADDSRRIMMVAGIVAAALVVAVIAYFALSGQGKPKPPANAPAFSELMSGMAASAGSLSKATVNAQGTMSITAQGETADMQMEFLLKYDAAGKRSYAAVTMSMGFMEQTIESYIINSTMYSVVPQTTGGGIWVKSDVGENAWGSEGLYIGQLAGMLSGEVVGEEVVNGVEAYKVAARVDAGKLVDLIMASQDMEAAGLTPEDADALAGQLADSVRSADATIWLRKSDSLPVKFSGDVALSIDLSGMSAGMAEGSLDISAAFSGTVDYDSAVDVKLPASAAAAIDAGGLYGLTACGDGLCEAGEDASSCPLDCGADENGCLSGEFWCESTQSCISLAVGMPLDVACPPV